MAIRLLTKFVVKHRPALPSNLELPTDDHRSIRLSAVEDLCAAGGPDTVQLKEHRSHL